jgi:hypothetical protein
MTRAIEMAGFVAAIALSLGKRRIHSRYSDTCADDWTGCRFAVAMSDGTVILQVSVLSMMNAIAR